MNRLSAKRIAVIATHGFEESELVSPVNALRSEGATVDILAPVREPLRAWKDKDWAETIEVDRTLDEVTSQEYDALVIPGGTLNSDQLRMNPVAVDLVRHFFAKGKPVAAICHGPQILIEADVVTGRELTSYQSLKTDLENAGALWANEAVVVDRGLVTSRTPDDLPAFIAKLIEEVEEGVHDPQHA
ncbi:MAG: type 1 glutamine amidotransferase [Deltaproteobacteria bacterium]|nr:type 1 glutamine amidotransferase [Deltaproteobacteria bacterium]